MSCPTDCDNPGEHLREWARGFIPYEERDKRLRRTYETSPAYEERYYAAIRLKIEPKELEKNMLKWLGEIEHNLRDPSADRAQKADYIGRLWRLIEVSHSEQALNMFVRESEWIPGSSESTKRHLESLHARTNDSEFRKYIRKLLGGYSFRLFIKDFVGLF